MFSGTMLTLISIMSAGLGGATASPPVGNTSPAAQQALSQTAPPAEPGAGVGYNTSLTLARNVPSLPAPNAAARGPALPNAFSRACCFEADPPAVCVDLYDVTACIAEGGRWSVDAEYCSQLDPPCGQYPGACCEGELPDPGYEPFQCVGDMLQWECLALGEATNWTGGRTCSDPTFLCPGQPGVLYCPSSGDNPAFRTALAALIGLPVDFINTANGTPTLEELMGYRAVLTWANYPYADNVTFGDNLADYVDAGGRVILGQWCLPTAGNYLSGRIMTAEYCPALASSWGSGSYNGDGLMCATVGVTTLTTSYLDLISGLQPGAMYDGTIGASYAAIWRPDMAVWYSPGNLGGSYESGDWAALTYNEIVCPPDMAGACCETTTTTCLDDIQVLDCIAMGAQWKWRIGLCAELVPPCGNPGACCHIHTGECLDNVLEVLCEAEQFTGGRTCGELEPTCGDPGCCCDRPEHGVITAPHFAYRADCRGRFISQEVNEECIAEVFDPACGLWYPTGVLYAPSNGDNAAFRAALSHLLCQPVDFLNTTNETPTIETLSQYRAVMTWANYPYADNVAFGDNLAAYVDMGGRVILGQWCLPTSSNYLSGRIMTAEYCPALASDWGAGSYNGDGTMCATIGVTTLITSYLDLITGLQPGATRDGTIGESYAAVCRPDLEVWYSPGNLGGSYETGDWAQLTYNQVACSNVPGPCCNLYTAQCIDEVMPIACFEMGPQWKWYFTESCAALVPPCGNPGACCDIYTGECVDDVLQAVCIDQGRQFTGGASCTELTLPCGDPGCCCDRPESGPVTAPHEAFRANCDGRFISGATGAACRADAFSPACGTWIPTAVLWAPTQSEDPTFHAALEALLNSDVDYWNAYSQGTPTLEQMLQYAVVATWVDYPYDDAIGMGNTLADYVDNGGRVILGQWTRHSDQRNWLDGRIMTDSDYCPVLACSTSFGSGCYGMDGTTGLHDGVGAHCAQYLDVVSEVAADAYTDGTIDGSISVIWTPNMHVFYCPGLTGSVYGSGDWVTKVANIAALPDFGSACCNIATGECLDDFVSGLDCMDLGPVWRWRWLPCHDLQPACGDPGACCDILSGGCIDEVLKYNCESLGRQFTSGRQCGELPEECGDPGCCCDRPEPGMPTEPHFAFRANCDGRFISGAYTLCGDLDASGVVDVIDYNMFLDCFGACAGQPAYLSAADLDSDGCITLVDFQTWRNCYRFQGTDCTPTAFVPECGHQVISSDLLGDDAPPDQVCRHGRLPVPPDSRPLFTDVTSVPGPFWGELMFDRALNHRAIGSGWMSWSHDYTGDVYYTNGAYSVAITMPPSTTGFYFYVEPNPFEVHPFQVVVNDIVSAHFEADGSSGAAGISICGTEVSPLLTVVVSSDIDFAIGEFGFADPWCCGACCAEWDGVCTDGLNASDCVAVPHYRFFTAGSCADLVPPCGEVRGACCYEEECVYQRPVECFNGDGRYAGDGVPCDPNPCRCADFYIDAPGEWTGSTCGAGDNCALRTGEDIIFAVTIPYDGQWTFSLCGSDFDTYWFFGYECCTAYWSQDDSTECGAAGYTEQQMTAGRYFIDLEGYGSCGNYVLTITPPPLGACCDSEVGGCTDDVLAADCAGDRFVPETLCADVTPPCGAPVWDAQIAAPGTWSGTTCDMGDKCATRAGEDVIVRVVIPTDGNWQFSLCGTPTTWDTYLYLGSQYCQNTWYDDDGCGTVLSRIQRPELPAGNYFLDIEPYSSGVCGDVMLEVSTYEPERTGATHVAPQQLERLRP